MPLVSTTEIVDLAAAERRGAGAFNVLQLEYAEVHVAASERVGRPVMLQITENCARHHGSVEPLGQAMLALARQAKVPVAVQLDDRFQGVAAEMRTRVSMIGL